MSSTVEHKHVKYNSLRVTKAGCNLYKPFRKGNSKTLHAYVVYTSAALKDTYSANKL